MKIQLLSDTHGSPYTLHPEADVIAHAGDFGNGLAAMRQFQAACNEAGKPYVFVLGNHDYYHENMSDVRLQLRDAPYLRAGKTVQINGRTFVGGTLFSNFRLPWVNKKQFRENLALARRNIADFSTSPQAKRRTSAAPNPKTTSSALMPNSISSSISATERAPSCSPTFRRTPPAPRRSMPIRP